MEGPISIIWVETTGGAPGVEHASYMQRSRSVTNAKDAMGDGSSRRRRTRHVAISSLTLLVVGGCETASDGSTAAQETATRDSAGIKIVESLAPAWDGGEAWTIDPTPVLQIGVQAGESAYEFGDISSAARGPDGRIAVADGDANEIRIFDGEGAHLRTIGRSGEGPGEFQAGPVVRWAGQDTLIAWDAGLRRLSWFDDAGNLLRDVSLLQLMGGLRAEFGRGGAGGQISRSGTLLAIGLNMEFPPDRHASDQLWRLRDALYLMPPGADTVIDLGLHGADEHISTAAGIGVKNPFSASARPALRSDPARVFVVGPSGTWEVLGFDAGGNVVEILRTAAPRTPISGEVLDDVVDRWRENPSSRILRPSEYLSTLRQFEIPDSLPTLRALYTDEAGNLWASRYVLPGQRSTENLQFDIVDPDGRWLGTVTPPQDVERILEIGSDHLLALWEDDLGVDHLRVYRIRKE